MQHGEARKAWTRAGKQDFHLDIMYILAVQRSLPLLGPRSSHYFVRRCCIEAVSSQLLLLGFLFLSLWFAKNTLTHQHQDHINIIIAIIASLTYLPCATKIENGHIRDINTGTIFHHRFYTKDKRLAAQKVMLSLLCFAFVLAILFSG